MPKIYTLAFQKQRKPDFDFIFGTRAVIEAIQAGKEFEKILIRKDLQNELVQELYDALKGSSIPVQKVPEPKLNKISRKNHQGVIAWISPIVYQDIEDILPTLFEEGKNPFILILDGITDVRNLGALARTAEGAGVDAIVVPAKGGAAVTADAVKTSAGALHRIPVCRAENLLKAAQFVKNSGCKLASASEKSVKDYHQHELDGPIAIVMGAEDTGVSTVISRISDCHLRIPMLGSIESLNVSVAGGILMYEVVKQRQLSEY